jgi:hypothetical protein
MHSQERRETFCEGNWVLPAMMQETTMSQIVVKQNLLAAQKCWIQRTKRKRGNFESTHAQIVG